MSIVINKFVLYSTKESIKKNKVSILSIFEVIFINLLYWIIAFSYDIYIHIILSILLTPFLLLKSEYSVKKTLDFLNLNLKYLDTFPFTKNKFIINTFFLSLIILFLSSQNYILIFFTLLSILCFLIYVTFKNMQLRILLESVFILGAFFFIGITFYYFKNTLHQDLNFFSELILTILSFTIGGIIFLLFSFAFVFIFSILIYKLAATTMYIKYGINNIIDNWKENVFVIDSFKTPELVLGIEEDKRIHSFFKFSKYKHFINYYALFFKLLKKFKEDLTCSKLDNSSIFITSIIKVSTFFLNILFYSFLQIYSLIFLFFSILYRFSIKSTFWFYLPLLFLVKTPSSIEENSGKIGEFFSSLYETYISKLRLFFALIVLGLFFLTYFNFVNFYELSTLFKSFLFLFYVDFSSLEIWKILQILIAILTIIIFLWANAVRTPKVSNKILLEKDLSFLTIFYLNIVRNWISFFYFSSAFIYLSFHYKFWENSFIPNGIKNLFIYLKEIIVFTPFS